MILIMRISFGFGAHGEWIIATSFQALGTNFASFVHEDYILILEKHISEGTML
jgi:hypothetical protein